MSSEERDKDPIDAWLARPAEMRGLLESAIERMREVIVPYVGAARSLMIAHGASIIGCLQFLKDAQPGPLRTEVSTLGSVLCAGFVLAIVGYLFIIAASNELLAPWWEKKDKREGMVPFRIGAGALALSGICLVIPVIALGSKLWRGEI